MIKVVDSIQDEHDILFSAKANLFGTQDCVDMYDNGECEQPISMAQMSKVRSFIDFCGNYENDRFNLNHFIQNYNLFIKLQNYFEYFHLL